MKKTIIPLFLLLLGVVLSNPNLILLRAHAATGEVCLADPSTATGSPTPCPSPAPVFAGPVGQEIRVGVFIQGSDALNGFDIILVADHTVLAPLSVDLIGTIVPGSTTIVLECIQGILKAGSVCAPTDNIDTLHLVLTAGLGKNTTSPTTGLLFTAIYNMTSATASGGIPLGFQTGCGSSPSVSGGVCITIANGSITPDPETSQGSTFDNSAVASMPFVTVTATPTSFGPEFPGTANTATVTATAMNGYGTGFGTDSVAFTTSATSGLTATLSGVNPCATGGTSCSVSLSLSATSAGNYTAVVSGTYATTDAAGNPDTLVGVVSLHVVVDDFGLTITPTSITFISGSTGVATASLSSLNHFVGSITLSSGSIAPSGLTISYSPTTVTLSAGQTISSTATFSASPISATHYLALIKATSGSRIKSSPTLSVQVNIGHLTTTSVSCVPSSVNVNSPSTCTATVTDTNASPTTPGGTVVFASDSAGSFTPATSCSLSAGTTGTASCQATYTPTSLGSGTHNVTGTYGGDTTHGRSIGKFLLTVTVPGATTTTTVDCSASSVTVDQASTCTATVTSSDSNTPTGSVSFNSDGSGSFVTSPCTLSGSVSVASCSVAYTPSAFGSGTHKITANYPGDTLHGGSNGNFNLTVTDFTLTAAPSTATVDVGSAGSSSITVSPMNGFAGDVALTSDNTACTLSPSTVTGFGSSTLSCTFTVAGTVTITVTGTIGSLSHTATVAFTVVDFTISASPASVTVGTNVAGDSAVTVAPLNGFSSTVSLAVSTNSTNLSCTVTPSSITGGSGISTLSCSGTVAGNYQSNVTGTSSSLSHSTLVTYHITAPVPDFSISANPTSLTLNATITGVSNVTVVYVNGFAGTVNLSVVTNSTKLVCSLSSSTVSSSGSVDASCSAVSAGNYLLNVTGVSGSLSHSVTVVFHIQDFGVSASPSTVTTPPGVTAHSTVSVTSLNGFSSAVSLSVTTNSTNLSCNLSTTSISGGSGTSTLSCSGPLGNYSANVTSTSGSLSKITTVIVQVTDFTMSASPTSLTGLASSAVGSTITVAPVGSFTGTVALSVSVASSGLSCSLSPNSVVLSGSQTSTLSCSGSSGNYTATVTGTSGSLSHIVAVTFAITDFSISANPTGVSVLVNTSGSSTVTVSPVNGFAGTVTLEVFTNSTNLSCTVSPTSVTGGSGTSTLSCQGSPFGNYLATVIGSSGVLSHSADVMFAVGDFDLSVSDATPVVAEGTSGSVTVTVTSLNGFSGTVNLVLTNKTSVPPGYPQPSFSLTPTSITGSGTATITIVVGPRVYPSTYQIQVNGTSGSHEVPAPQIVLTVPRPDFSITHSPATAVIIVPGQTGTANINVTATNGYNGSVTFSYSASPSGLTCSFSRSSVILLPGGLNTTTISCSGSSQVYAVTVTGTAVETYDQGITHVTIPVYSVIDFTLQPTPSGITVNVGQTAHAQINVTWTTGYAGIVTFKAFPSNSAVAAVPVPASLTGSGTVTLDVSSTTSGTFTVIVNATSNSVTHSTTITLTVLAPANSSILGLDPTVFYSIVGVLIVLVAVAGVLMSRRGKPPSRKK